MSAACGATIGLIAPCAANGPGTRARRPRRRWRVWVMGSPKKLSSVLRGTPEGAVGTRGEGPRASGHRPQEDPPEACGLCPVALQRDAPVLLGGVLVALGGQRAEPFDE